MKKIKKLALNCERIFLSFLTILSPEINTKVNYRILFHKRINLENPETFNEKILWLKINCYMNNPLVIKCADKYEVRDYVTDCGCENILNNLVEVYNSADEIDYKSLPEEFVLKWNFGSGYNIIVNDKKAINCEEIKQKLNKWGKSKYWLLHSEMQYKYMPKRIVCESLLHGSSVDDVWIAPEDYKVYCFDGKADCVMVCIGREKGTPKFYFFDKNWNFLRINKDGKNAPEGFSFPRPAMIDEAFMYAEQLSKPFPFVRVDFFITEGRIYFGELTFTPCAGLDKNVPESFDNYMGEKIDLLKIKNEWMYK